MAIDDKWESTGWAAWVCKYFRKPLALRDEVDSFIVSGSFTNGSAETIDIAMTFKCDVRSDQYYYKALKALQFALANFEKQSRTLVLAERDPDVPVQRQGNKMR